MAWNRFVESTWREHRSGMSWSIVLCIMNEPASRDALASRFRLVAFPGARAPLRLVLNIVCPS
eukprot:5960562-Pyramimonas_sp.AAC.1